MKERRKEEGRSASSSERMLLFDWFFSLFFLGHRLLFCTLIIRLVVLRWSSFLFEKISYNGQRREKKKKKKKNNNNNNHVNNLTSYRITRWRKT